MKISKCCNLYIDDESRFCPYCGKKIRKAVQQVKLEDVTQKLTVKTEAYKYKGEERNRYVFYKSQQDKISSFVPDFSAEIEDAWLVEDNRIIIVTNQQKIVKLRVLGINKKGSSEICKLPSDNCGCSRNLYVAEDGRFLLSERYYYGKTNFYLINEKDIRTYSVKATVFDMELYSDDTIVCNQGREDVYLLTSDGLVQTASSLYDKEELLRRYHMQCIKTDRFCYPEIIWNLPYIESQTLDRNSGEIFVSLCCGKYRDRYDILGYRHKDTLTVKLDEELPIGKMLPVLMEVSEWQQEAADICYIEDLVKKDNPEWKLHHRLYAFCNLGEDVLYGTGEQEQFIYNRKYRALIFFPLRKFKEEVEIIEFAIEYVKKYPDKILFAQHLEQMHLLDSVTEKLIQTHEARLQPFFQYMKDAWQYDSMVKGEGHFRNITYSTGNFLAAVDMVIGVYYKDETGKGMVGWMEQEVMYTERVTGMLVRMNTPYGKKVVKIPFGQESLVVVFMTDDQPANNRSEWYTALKEQWKHYPRKELPNIPVPYRTINVCSDAVNRVEMSKYHLYSDNYRLQTRRSITNADLLYSPNGYKLEADECVGSFYYRLDDNVKVVVDYLTDIHLYALSQDGIFFIKDYQLHFRGRNNESRSYDGNYYDSVRLLACDNYIFIDCVSSYIKGQSYDAYGDTVYLTDFSVKYQTNVISRATGKCVAVWEDMPEITQLYQGRNNTIIVATGKTWYEIADSDEGICSLSASTNRQEKGKQVLTEEHMGKKAYALIEQYGVENFVGSRNDGKIRMIVDGTYKDFF